MTGQPHMSATSEALAADPSSAGPYRPRAHSDDFAARRTSRRSTDRAPAGTEAVDDATDPSDPRTPQPGAVGSELLTDMNGWFELRMLAETFEDAQKARIACDNRMQRGGVHPDHYLGTHDALHAAEREAEKQLKRCYLRVVPVDIIQWQKAVPGLGEHTLARLLGLIGHPRIAHPYHWDGEGSERILVPDPPFERSLKQLYAYCNVGDPARRRRKGMSVEETLALGKAQAHMLLWNMALSMLRKGDRSHYDAARQRYDERDWSDGRRHNAALRYVQKEVILRGLWEAAGASIGNPHAESRAALPV